MEFVAGVAFPFWVREGLSVLAIRLAKNERLRPLVESTLYGLVSLQAFMCLRPSYRFTPEEDLARVRASVRYGFNPFLYTEKEHQRALRKESLLPHRR